MLNFIKNLVTLNGALLNKARSITAYTEALAFQEANEHDKALALMIEASELGNVQAMSVLGSMYLLGRGVKEDGRQAVAWLQKAIDGGFEDAISVLGMAYATGKAGIKVDIPKAREMLIFSADRGDEQSARMLGMMDRGEGVFRGQKKSRR
ncbi:tetratricopeptide repeat protein [Dechloromonas denitrificans]|uniref:tetratricopeptide repeat protein n=1 Tax=Dechloromonas denitrificans TaxID=281362 RepID=UPI001CF86227|nr:tetratricopeptide repeat protein [Dechloromonas denitrificans]UCV04959.1 sel1 repeat family protein [Dechloromonas denitrificans]